MSISESKSTKKIAFGAIAGYIALFVQILSGIVFVPLISKHYGQDQYGLITLSNSFVSLFMTDIGLSMITNRYLSIYRARGDKEQIGKILALIYRAFFILSGALLLLFIILFFFLDKIFAGLTAAEHSEFQFIYLISSLFSVAIFPMHTFDGTLNAYEEYAVVKFATLVDKILYICLVSCAIAFDWPIYTIPLITSLSTFVCYCFKYLYIKFKLHVKANFHIKIEKTYLKEVVFFSLWQSIASLLRRLCVSTSPSILGVVSDSDNIAVYGVASQIETYAFNFCNVVANFFLPKVTRIFENKELVQSKKIERLEALAKKVAILVSSLTLLMVVGFISCGEEFIDVWMNDPSYETSYYCCIFLMVGEAFVSPNFVLRNCFYFQNNMKHLTIAYLICDAFFFPLGFFLGYYYGAIGVSVAVFFNAVIMIIYTSIFYKKKIGIHIGKYYLDVYLKQIFPIVVVVAIGLLLHFFLPFSNLYKLLIIVPSVAIPYLLIYWFFIYPRELKEEIKSLLHLKKKVKGL